jgi:hypothetical protein
VDIRKREFCMDAEENLLRGRTIEEGTEGGGANVIQSDGAKART